MKFRVLITTLALLASHAAWGQSTARATGSATGNIWAGCTAGCGHLPLTLSGTPQQNVTDPVSAQVDYLGQAVPDTSTAAYTLGGEAEYHALAFFEGPLPQPVLGAYARADNELSANTAGVANALELYAVSSQASTQQTFHYLGGTTTTYTFDFHVDAMLSHARAGAFGIAAIYTGEDPFFERGLIDADHVDLDGTGILHDPQPYSGSFSVSVTVDPGESFVLIARLSATAQIPTDATDVLADAMNTMRMTAISGGDPALLSITPVPEPATALLLPLGLIALLGWRRARQAASGATPMSSPRGCL